MNILLDECVPKRLKQLLEGHRVSTVQERGWSGLENGALLSRAADEFQVFITVDKNLQYQQNLAKARIAVLLLMVRRNRISAILPLVPEIRRALESIKSGELVILGSK